VLNGKKGRLCVLRDSVVRLGRGGGAAFGINPRLLPAVAKGVMAPGVPELFDSFSATIFCSLFSHVAKDSSQ